MNENLMFAPMSVRLAAMGERDRQEKAERLERERIERDAAQARDQSPEQVAAERAQVFQATAVAAIAKVDYGTQVAATRQEAEKAERQAEIDRLAVGIGDRISDRQMPVLTEILNVLKQIKANQKEDNQSADN